MQTKIRADRQRAKSLTQCPSISRLTPVAEHISIKLMSSLIIFKLFLRADTLAGVKLCGQVKINQPYCASSIAPFCRLLHRASKWRFGTPLQLEPPVLLHHQGVQWYSTLTQQGVALYNHKPSQPDQISRTTTSPTPNLAS